VKIIYYLDEKNISITACPNGMQVFGVPYTVGAYTCQSCKYFGGEYLKTVNCLYKKGKPK
jgi:hypothetical protein